MNEGPQISKTIDENNRVLVPRKSIELFYLCVDVAGELALP